MRSPVISLLGRPNVGKSSLFNLFVPREQKRVTFDRPGITRDRHYSFVTLDAELPDIILVDTGGFFTQDLKEQKNDKSLTLSQKLENQRVFFNLMAKHAYQVIEESDLVLLVVDARTGLSPFDQLIAKTLRSKKKNFWLVINKFDSEKQQGEEAEFYALGLEPEKIFLTSAEHNRGVEFLKESLCDFIKQKFLSDDSVNNFVASPLQSSQTTTFTSQAMDPKSGEPEVLNPMGLSSPLPSYLLNQYSLAGSVAILGAPNVGKSTLLNQLVGHERSLVSELAGTTLDPVESFFNLYFEESLSSKVLGLKKEHKKKSEVIAEDDIAPNHSEFSSEETKRPWESFEHGLEDQVEEQIEEQVEAAAEGEEEVWIEENTPSDISFEDWSLHDLANENKNKNENENKNKNDTETDKPIIKQKQPGQWYSVRLLDTAGIRRQKSIKDKVEIISVYRALKAVAQADIVLYVIDATQKISHQDRRLCEIVLEKGKSLILCLNKYDLVKKQFKTPQQSKEWFTDFKNQVPWLHFCQLVTLSAMKGEHIGYLKNVMSKTFMIRHFSISTGPLNRAFQELLQKNPLIVNQYRGTLFKIKYASMIKSDPPTFIIFCNRIQNIPVHYRRYLTNGLRRYFSLINTPIHFIFRSKSRATEENEQHDNSSPNSIGL